MKIEVLDIDKKKISEMKKITYSLKRILNSIRYICKEDVALRK